ncbi:MAG TPA: aldo/keto reductase [Streptosporangiaceae bacterium]
MDTADVYGDGRSEEIIGRWLAARQPDVTEPVVLATKGRFASSRPDAPNGAGLSARHLTRALDASLVAIAWVTARPGVSSTILGARTTSQLDANPHAAGLRLTLAETAALDTASDPHPADYPYGELGADQRARTLPPAH